MEVSLIVSDGKFSNITVTPKNGYDSTTNVPYITKAANGTKKDGCCETDHRYKWNRRIDTVSMIYLLIKCDC